MSANSVRLDRLLANLGYGSRRDIHILARQGRITLDGAVFDDVERRFDLSEGLRASLSVDGEQLDPLPGMVLMLNKPLGVTCSHREAGPLVYSLLPERWRRRDPPLSTVGRLDKDTSGLLLVTDDGALLHKIISPRRQISKIYRAVLGRPFRGDEAAIFASGEMMLAGENKPLLPALLNVLGPKEARVTIFEGRYHQIRRMFVAVGNHVVDLDRESVGGLSLDENMAPGEYRLLEPDEIETIFA